MRRMGSLAKVGSACQTERARPPFAAMLGAVTWPPLPPAGCHAKHLRHCVRHQQRGRLHGRLPAGGLYHRAPGARLE